jgi:uncharacterized protein (DUF362 family)
LDTVALVEHTDSITDTLQKGIKLVGGLDTMDLPIIIKPNICTISDGTGHSVTDVRLVEGIVTFLLTERKETPIRIVESDSQSKYALEAFQKFGYKALVERLKYEGYDIDLIDLSRDPLVTVPIEGFYFKALEIHESLTKPHFFISVAVAKTHYLSAVTGILKNQFGLLPRKDQGFYHSRIDDVIVDLNKYVKPSFSIVDARVGVEGWNGPKTHQINALILGHSPVGVDATMARIMRLEPEKIAHLIECSREGLGSINPIVVGAEIDSLSTQFRIPK